ncbi:MAG: Hpt domain-containing protein, partial [Lachnospiraceae bacterium]|nr:Hpt domain-containing protein [Lachnospiraceae bacterium]
MDVSQYLEIFIDETKEHLQTLSEQLMILEQEPKNEESINEIFRAAHSLKGMAGTMGFKRMQHLTHMMENAFSEVRSGNLNVTEDLVDILFQCLDALEAYLDLIMDSADEGTEDNEAIITRLNNFMSGGSNAPAPVAKAEEPKKEEKPEGGSPNTKNIKLADFEIHAINEALEKGLNVYTFTVYV